MDLRLLILLGLLGYGAYKAFSKPASAAADDELTAKKRGDLLARGLEVASLTPAEIQVVWQFKYHEDRQEFEASDKLLPQVKMIMRKYALAI